VASTDNPFAIIDIVALWKILSFLFLFFNNFPGSSVVGVIFNAARLGNAGVGEQGTKQAGGQGAIVLSALANHEQSNPEYS